MTHPWASHGFVWGVGVELNRDESSIGSSCSRTNGNQRRGEVSRERMKDERQTLHGTAIYIYIDIYAYIGVVWGVNVGIYASPMECLGTTGGKLRSPLIPEIRTSGLGVRTLLKSLTRRCGRRAWNARWQNGKLAHLQPPNTPLVVQLLKSGIFRDCPDAHGPSYGGVGGLNSLQCSGTESCLERGWDKRSPFPAEHGSCPQNHSVPVPRQSLSAAASASSLSEDAAHRRLRLRRRRRGRWMRSLGSLPGPETCQVTTCNLK